MLISTIFLLSTARNAMALTTITGTVGSAGKYLLTGAAVNVTANAVLKITFETTTGGVNLALCAGSGSDFVAGSCPIRLNDSGGPGFTFLTIVDSASLNGKLIYVIREVGINAASFKLTIE
jgi:hypothetical protein